LLWANCTSSRRFFFLHTGAALGFALAVSTLDRAGRGVVVVVQQDFAALEAGHVYGVGCDLFGVDTARLFVVRAMTPRDALWAMEEALKTRGVAAVIGGTRRRGQERRSDHDAPPLAGCAKRRRAGAAAPPTSAVQPSAAATRWSVAAVAGAADGFGGIGALRLSRVADKKSPRTMRLLGFAVGSP
jgi:hypothetical protein